MSASEARLVAILDGIAEAFYAVGRDWRVTVFNRGAEEFFQRPRTDIIGRVLWDTLPITAVPGLEAAFRAALEGTTTEVAPFASLSRMGRWIEGRVFPLPDGVGAGFRDVTKKLADERNLLRREAELARVQRIAGVGGMEVELGRGFENRRSPEYLLLHGLPPEAATETHQEWVDRIHPDDRERADQEFRSAMKSGDTTYTAEYRIIRPSDGATRWIAVSAEVERDSAGRAIRLIGAHRDVTERKQVAAQQALLINELNHRVKNTLATVQSIAAQSLRTASSQPDAWRRFEERLLSLSRAHNVLTRENWSGAQLHDILGVAIEPFRNGSIDQFGISGERIMLSPRMSLAFAMGFQELATNAAKYGALSTNAGVVEIGWRIDAPSSTLRLTWRERGGPPVQVGDHRGFGMRLLTKGLPRDIDGSVELDFDTAGVTCMIVSGLAHLHLPPDLLRD